MERRSLKGDGPPSPPGRAVDPGPKPGRRGFNALAEGRVGSSVSERPGSEQPEEPELVRAVQQGDIDAFGRLVDSYVDEAYAVAMGILQHPQDAEDAVQDAFIRALERMDHLEPGSHFGAWFYRVVRSTCLNLRRREKLRRHGPVPPGASGDDDPEATTVRKLERERILEALDELPEMQRTAVMLYDLEGYSHKEIAEALEIAPGTSRAHLHHGRKALRELLSAEETKAHDG